MKDEVLRGNKHKNINLHKLDRRKCTFGGALERRSGRKGREEGWEGRKHLLAEVGKGNGNNVSLF